MLGFAVLFLLGLLCAIAFVTAWTLHRLLHPPRRTYATALAQGRPGQPDQLRGPTGTPRSFESWTISWRGMDLPVWDIAGDAPSGPVVIMTHGWGDSRIGALARAEALLPDASRVIAWDMPGHGDAPGSCLLGVHEHEALRALVERVAGNGTPVVLLGWSLGAGVSLAAMSGWEGGASGSVRCVICEAPYRLPQTPARNMMWSFRLPTAINLPVAMALARLRIGAPPFWQQERGTFDRASFAASVRAPVVIIHGEDDAIAPVQDARDIAAAAPHAQLLTLPDAGHYSLWTAEPARAMVVDRVRSFMAAHTGA